MDDDLKIAERREVIQMIQGIVKMMKTLAEKLSEVPICTPQEMMERQPIVHTSVVLERSNQKRSTLGEKSQMGTQEIMEAIRNTIVPESRTRKVSTRKRKTKVKKSPKRRAAKRQTRKPNTKTRKTQMKNKNSVCPMS